MYKPTREELQELVALGYVDKQTHNYLPLEIYNYTAIAMFHNYWTDAVRAARGLVMDTNGRIVSLPFPKFFNLEEHSPQVLQQYQDIEYETQEKADGSLITLSNDPEYGLIVSSRKSFHSWHAKQAHDLITNHDYSFDHNVTYLFELIGQENQIVVNYGPGLRLILLGAINSSKGQEITNNLQSLAESINHPTQQIPSIWTNTPIYQIKDRIPKDEEGVVVRFEDGFRIKVKGDQYVYLHRLVSGLNEKTVWEAMKDGVELEGEFPEEFQDWIDRVRDDLKQQYQEYDQHAREIYSQVPEGDRKTQAMFIKENTNSPSLVFSLLDGRDDKYHQAIMQQIKPVVAEATYEH